jgi:hypothetical protein
VYRAWEREGSLPTPHTRYTHLPYSTVLTP